mgnify:CR=1 FL=1
MKIRESEEMYLETILLLKKTKPDVRSVDIVNELGYAKSSVSVAVHRLKDKGYISIDENSIITFTAAGKKKAQAIYDKHRVITDLLKSIGASDEVAEENACRIEHVISPEMFEIIKSFNKKS